MTALQPTAYPRPGYTLVELAVSTAVMGIILGGIASALILASRTLPNRSSPAAAVSKAGELSDQILGELAYALSIISNKGKSIAFTVADRDGDNAPERIEYQWSGTAGDPLTRKYNDAPFVNIAGAVQEFRLDYVIRTEPLPESYSEGPESLLGSYDSSVGLADQRINSSYAIGEYFMPTLPADAKSWRVTRVRFQARIHGASIGETRVQLRLPDSSNLPGDTIVDQVAMIENELGYGYAWKEFAFANAGGLNPAKGLCLVFKWAGDADSCDIRYQSYNAWASNANLVLSTNGGTSWSSPFAQEILFYVYGRATLPDPPAYQYVLTNVQLALRTGTIPTTRVNSSVQVLSQPLVDAP